MQSRTPMVAVVGSLNMDLVTSTERRPALGETLAGRSFGLFVGGKGLNQAIAVARCGAQVQMIGRVGQDAFGERLMQTLERDGIDARSVTRDTDAVTGTATIIIEGAGDNSIIIVAGANGRLSPADVEHAADTIAAADVLLLQLEVPLETVQRAAEIAHAAGTRVLLNPAPARPLPDTLLQLVDVLTPNETETTLLTGRSIDDEESAAQAAHALLARGVGAVVLTLGARGALLATHEHTTAIPSYRVAVVDTTAAGDAFCGALGVELAAGRPLAQAVHFANAAGALATTILGAEPAMPARAAVEQLQSTG